MISLHVAKQTVKWASNCIATGYDAPEVFHSILFDVFGCDYGAINEDTVDEYSQEYEISRGSLMSVRDSIIQKDELYSDNEDKILQSLKKIDMSLGDFVGCLNRLISESDQSDEWVRMSWF